MSSNLECIKGGINVQYVSYNPNNYVAMSVTAPSLAKVFTNQISKFHTFAEVVSQCANISQQGVCKQTLTSAR